MKQISTILLLLFLFSVTTHSQKVVTEDYSQEIIEATPSPLPQTALVKRELSDAQESNLKGKVKTVTMETDLLTGLPTNQGRKLSRITDFDETGNQVKVVLYASNGIPQEVSVYGYIDGKRVRNSQYTKSSGRGFPSVNSNIKQETPVRDLRYEDSIENKYADGKLAEKKLISNNGAVWRTHIYKYNKNQVEELVFYKIGEPGRKYLSTLDENGNAIENVSINLVGTPMETKNSLSTRYDSFDEKGNWTKKTTLVLIIENGKQIYKPTAVSYQTITYYP